MNMGTAEEDARHSLVATLMNGKQADRDKFIISTLLDLKENGCAQKCGSGVLERWTPAAIGTALTGAAIAVIEYFRSGK